MDIRIYRDAPIKNPVKKSTAKQTEVLPRILEKWDEIRSLNNDIENAYYQCEYGWSLSEEGKKTIRLGFLKVFANYFQKDEFDMDYIMRSRQYLFGKILADVECEEEKPLTRFDTSYYMTYLDLGSAKGLQGYLALRTRLRRYEYVKTRAYSPLYLYVYELLNLIGVKDEREALQRLVWLREQFAAKNNETKNNETDGNTEIEELYERRLSREQAEDEWDKIRFRRNLSRWIIEFGWYYGCDDVLGDDVKASCMVDFMPRWMPEPKRVNKLENIEELSDDELVEEILKFTGSDVYRSVFRREHRQDFDGIIAKIYRKMDERTRKKSGQSWIEKKTKRQIGYREQNHFFGNAIFFYGEHKNKAIGRKPLEEAAFKVYFPEMEDGREWRGGMYEVAHIFTAYPVDKLRAILKYLDWILREKTKFRARIKKPEIMTRDAQLVEKTIREFFEQRRAKEQAERLKAIEINRQAVENIRSDAEVTRDSLLVEDELAEVDMAQIADAKVEIDAGRDEGEAKNEIDLTSEERGWLESLVNGGKCEMSSLEVDRMNGKLYDIVGDNVLEIDNGEVILYDDYIEDVRKLLDHGK